MPNEPPALAGGRQIPRTARRASVTRTVLLVLVLVLGLAALMPTRAVAADGPLVLPPIGRRALARLLHDTLAAPLSPADWNAIERAHDRFWLSWHERPAVPAPTTEHVGERGDQVFLEQTLAAIQRDRRSIARDRALARAESALFEEIASISSSPIADDIAFAAAARRLERDRSFVFQGLHAAGAMHAQVVAIALPIETVRRLELDEELDRALRPSIIEATHRLGPPLSDLRRRTEALLTAGREHDLAVARLPTPSERPGTEDAEPIAAARDPLPRRFEALAPLVAAHRRALQTVRTAQAQWIDGCRAHVPADIHRRLAIMTICERWRAAPWLDDEPVVVAWARRLPDRAPFADRVHAAIERWNEEALATAFELQLPPAISDGTSPYALDGANTLLPELRAIAARANGGVLAEAIVSLESMLDRGGAAGRPGDEDEVPVDFVPGGLANARAIAARAGWAYARRLAATRGATIDPDQAAAFDLRRLNATRVHLDHRTPFTPLAASDITAIPNGDRLLEGDPVVVAVLFDDYRRSWQREIESLDDEARALESRLFDVDQDRVAVTVDAARIDRAGSARRRLLEAIARLDDALVRDLDALRPRQLEPRSDASAGPRFSELVAYEIATFRAVATLPSASDAWQLGPHAFSPIAAHRLVHAASPENADLAKAELLSLRDAVLDQLRAVVTWDHAERELRSRFREATARGGRLHEIREQLDRTALDAEIERLSTRRRSTIASWDRTRDEIESSLVDLVPDDARADLRTAFDHLDHPDLFDPRVSWLPLLRAVETVVEMTGAERAMLVELRRSHRAAVVALGEDRMAIARRIRGELLARGTDRVDLETWTTRSMADETTRRERIELDDRLRVRLALLLGDERARAFPALDDVVVPRLAGSLAR